MQQYSKKKISLHEFNNIETKDELKYELIDGFVLMSPRPNYRHQEVMGSLYLEIGNFLKGKLCKVFTESELEINDEVLIPDLSIICGLENSNFQRYKKPPEIVIEILSPGSQYTDTFTKLYKYELFGVQEYWTVDPKNESITIFNFQNKTNTTYNKSEKLTSPFFGDLVISLSDIFV